ncbi:hypothetical protein NMY22_g2810 [Coprinellus aureogranulatus]|nr:hypothetical protein NMY22_g2810 [Coprinellus aureogranulatus]
MGWFQAQGGAIDLASMGLAEFPASEGGRGAVALKDIEEGHILFSIPRDLTLSTRTSALPALFGLENWQKFGLHEGWSGLILSMMWEAAQGPKSKWAGYFSILPASFDTPMFWDAPDLAELKGTSIVEKLGKEDAENEYRTKLIPAVESRADLFPPADHATYYSLETFHIMGSRILSRSFSVEKWQGGGDHEEHAGDKSTDSAMDVDEQSAEDPSQGHEGSDDQGDENDSDEEGEQADSSDTAMVPMADMLNARYEHANASLFYEKEVLNMVATRPIKAGETMNCHGTPIMTFQNSELLRRYGHVDLHTSFENGSQGNPGDVVEMPATVVVDAVKETRPTMTEEALTERIDWWLEMGGDDVFDFDWEPEYPDPVFSLIRLLLLSDADWKKAQEKSKLPKSKPDVRILEILQVAIQRRMGEYPTSIQDDEALLQRGDLSLNHRNAVIVRLGEKKILDAVLGKVKADIAAQGSKLAKRKSESQTEAKASKKSRR